MNRAPGRLALVACLLLGGLLAHRARATDTVVYYHTDALRSVAVVTNAAGQVIERTYYAPYGAVLKRPLRDGPGYTGHREDAETGLVYMQQRYYDPETARFLSADPVPANDKGGNFNRYWYANDNPYRYIDPSGMASKQAERKVKEISQPCTGSHTHCPSETRINQVGSPSVSETKPPPAQQSPEITYKHGVPPGSPAVHAMLICTAKCMGQSIRVTSTSESTPVHGANDVHTRGVAADVTTSDPRALMQCAANCGAVFQLNEYAHPSRNSTAGHVHLQLVPGRNGGTGPYYPQTPPQSSHLPEEDQGP